MEEGRKTDFWREFRISGEPKFDTNEQDEEGNKDEEYVDRDYEFYQRMKDMVKGWMLWSLKRMLIIHVFEEFEDMGYHGEISDNKNEIEELRDLDEEDDPDECDSEMTISKRKRKKTFVVGKTWIPERELKDPHFQVGQQFANSKDFNDTVKKCAVKNEYDLYFNKKTDKKMEVICGKKIYKGKRQDMHCPFWIYASFIKDKAPELVIKTLDLEHKRCAMVPRVQMCTSTFLAKKYMNTFRVDPYMSRKLFQAIVKKDFGQSISHKQVIKARKLTGFMNSGKEAEQYNLLETYVQVLRDTNPESTVELTTEMDADVRKFKRFYVCLDACKRGWITTCRPVVGLDGYHIKTKFPGQLLSVVGIDDNNRMFPITYAVVELENKETWIWFLKKLI
ncbi:hypothetical protein M0R45_007031 [Rubus argutus]|uniref:MULE transposase domain-containing protein n=1 Tax=Rubus argutus TaxID=59490 RepID=A0AAW1YSN5_RUBAR